MRRIDGAIAAIQGQGNSGMTVKGLPIGATAKKFFKEFGNDAITMRAGNLAFRFFMSLFPALLALAALGSLIAKYAGIDNPADQVMRMLGDTLPPDAAAVVRDQVDGVVEEANPGLLSVSFAGALWAASSGTGALLRAINDTYDDAIPRPFWRATAVNVATTIGATVGLIAVVAGIVVAQVFAPDIAEAIHVGSQYHLVVGLLQLPVLVALVLLAVALLYWLAPTVDIPFRWISPGSLAFVLAWLPFTIGFAFYVANFSSYNATYGALGGIVILMLWFYYSAVLILAGSELNAVLTVERPPSAEPFEPGAETTEHQAVETADAAEHRRVRHRGEYAGQPYRRGAFLAALVLGLLALSGLWRERRHETA